MNPSNIQAFIETRNNINSILTLEDSYYVAFSGVAAGLKTTDVFLRRYDRPGGEWDSTRRISNGSGLNRAPVLLSDGDTVLVAWMLDRISDGGGVSIGFRRSPDRGQTWDEPLELALGSLRTRVPQLATDGKRLFIAISNADQGKPEEVLLFSSADGGALLAGEALRRSRCSSYRTHSGCR